MTKAFDELILDFASVTPGLDLAPIGCCSFLHIYTRSGLCIRKVDDSKVVDHGGNNAVSNAASPYGRYATLTHPLVRPLKEKRISALRCICDGYVVKTMIIGVIDSALQQLQLAVDGIPI